MINLQELRSALAPLQQIGNQRLPFEVTTPEGQVLSILLRSLLPAEEVESNRYASSRIKDDREEEEGAEGAEGEDSEKSSATQATIMDYFDHYRVGLLSYSLCNVGDTEISEYVETGETTGPNQVPVKIPKHEALRKELRTWNRVFLARVFIKYTELTEIAEKEAHDAIQIIDTDIELEIEKAEEHLAELKATKKQRKRAEDESHEEIAAKVQTYADREREQTEEMIADAQKKSRQRREAITTRLKKKQKGKGKGKGKSSKKEPRETDVLEAAKPERKRILPSSASPEGREDQPSDPPQSTEPSSFVDFSDAEAAQDAVLRLEAEKMAALKAHATRQEPQEPQEPQDTAPAQEPRNRRVVPPHAAAKVAQKAAVARSSRPTHEGTVDGVDVFRLPTQHLQKRRATQPDKDQKKERQVNVTSQGSSQNPRFKPSK